MKKHLFLFSFIIFTAWKLFVPSVILALLCFPSPSPPLSFPLSVVSQLDANCQFDLQATNQLVILDTLNSHSAISCRFKGSEKNNQSPVSSLTWFWTWFCLSYALVWACFSVLQLTCSSLQALQLWIVQ